MAEFHHTYALIANGAIHNYNQIKPLIQTHACVVAVDGGVNHCHKMKITPDMIVGDMDSALPEILEHYAKVPVRRFPCHKDETDIELAVQAVFTPVVEKITLFAALEKRTDHSLANLHLIRRYPKKVYIETEAELIFAFDETIEIPCITGQSISFIHIGDPVSGVNSKGLKWELRDAKFSKYFMSVSNICVENSVRLTIKEGDLLCCLQKHS